MKKYFCVTPESLNLSMKRDEAIQFYLDKIGSILSEWAAQSVRNSYATIDPLSLNPSLHGYIFEDLEEDVVDVLIDAGWQVDDTPGIPRLIRIRPAAVKK